MSSEEISTWLDQGLAAAASGDRVFARQQLQRVIEADDHNLQAWQALSEIAATLEDREVCLENVLALNSNNSQAREQLDLVRAQIADVSEAEVKEVFSPMGLSASLSQPIRIDFADDHLDDPLLCVYCGHLTQEHDLRCPKCQRGQYQSFYKHEHARWIVLGWIINIVDMFYTIGVLGVLLFFISTALSATKLVGQGDLGQLLLLYSGQATTLSPQAQAAVLTALPRDFVYFRLGYSLFMLIVAFGLLTRRRVFHLLFIASVAAATAAVFLNYNFSNTILAAGDASAATPFERILSVAIFEASNVSTVIIGAIAVVLLMIRLVVLFLVTDDFEKITERLWNQIDRSANNSRTAFVRAKAYMQREMWTLAARYLQQAVTLDSTTSDYFLALAESYAHLERYPRALDMLDQADQLPTNSAATPHLRGVILQLQQRAAQASEKLSPPSPAVKGNVDA
jgi:tetratricopeptide (TPR) repeat protein